MEALASLALLLGIGIALLLLCRAFLLWYWKVEERVRLAKEQNALLRDVRDALRVMTLAAVEARGVTAQRRASAPAASRRANTAPV